MSQRAFCNDSRPTQNSKMHYFTSHAGDQTIYQSANCLNTIFSYNTKESDYAFGFEAVTNRDNSPYMDRSRIDNVAIDDHCKTKLLVLQINVKSLVNNVNFCKLQALLMTCKPNISATEVWIQT